MQGADDSVSFPGLRRTLENAGYKAAQDAFARSGALLGGSVRPAPTPLRAVVLDTPHLAAAAWTAAFLRPGRRRLDELIAFHQRRKDRRLGSIHDRPLALWQVGRNHESAAWIDSFLLPALGYLALDRSDIRLPSRVKRLLAAYSDTVPDTAPKAADWVAARKTVGAGKATEALEILLPRFRNYVARVRASQKERAKGKSGVSLASGIARVADDALINGKETRLGLISLVENDYRSDDPEKFFRMARLARTQGDPLHGNLLCSFARLKAIESNWELRRLVRLLSICHAMSLEALVALKRKQKQTGSSRKALAEMLKNSLAFGNRASMGERIESLEKANLHNRTATREQLKRQDNEQRPIGEMEALRARLNLVDFFELAILVKNLRTRKGVRSVDHWIDRYLWDSIRLLDKIVERETRRCLRRDGAAWCAGLRTGNETVQRALRNKTENVDLAALESFLKRFQAELAPRKRALRDHLLAHYPSVPREEVRRRTDRLGDRFSRRIRKVIETEYTRVSALRSWRHSGGIGVLAFSPDGRALLTGSKDGIAVLRDVGSGKTLHSWRHRGDVTAAAFSPDGRTLVTGSQDGTAVLRDRGTGKSFHAWRHGRLGVYAAAFSADGRYVLTGASDRIAVLRDTATGKLRHSWQQPGRVVSVALSPYGRFAFVGHAYKRGAKLYRTSTGKRIRAWKSRQSPTAIAFSPDGRYLLTGYNDGRVMLETVEPRGKSRRHSLKHMWSVRVVAFSPDGQRILTGSDDGRAAIRDVRTGKTLHSWRNAKGVSTGTFSPDGRTVAVGTYDGHFVLRNVGSGAELRRWRSAGEAKLVAFSGDGRNLLTVTKRGRGYATLRDIGTGAAVREWSAAGLSALSPDGRMLLTGLLDGTAILHDIRTGTALHSWRHTRSVNVVAFSPDGRIALTGSDDDMAALRDVRTGRTLHSWWHQSRTGVTAAAFSPDGRSVLTVSTDRRVAMRALKGGGIAGRLQLRDDVTAVALSSDGRQVLIGSEDNTAVLWNPRDRKVLYKWRHRTDVTAVAFSPDGRHALTASSRTVALRATDTGKTVRQWRHKGSVTAVAFSPDGQHILTGSRDDTVVLRDPRTGKDVHSWQHSRDVIAVSFSPDGRYVLTSSVDGTAVLRDIRTGKAERTWRGRRDVAALAFSPDGRIVAVAWRDGTVALFASPGGASLAGGRN